MLETEKRRKEKRWKRLGCVQPRLSSVWHTGLSGGASDTVRCARPNSGEQAALGRSLATYGYNSPDCPVVHRAVRWANGRLGQRSTAQFARDAWPCQRSDGSTGLSGVHRTVSGAPTAPRLQRSTAPILEGNRAPDSVRWCTELSGAPTDRRQELRSWITLNGS
jgi:hypothetical protein